MQSVALKLLKEAHPKGLWNGDCDLGDGKLQQMRQEFQKRTSSLDVAKMGMNRDLFEECIRSGSNALSTDITFLADGLNKTNTPHSTLMHLCWETVVFNTLLQQSQAIQARLDNLPPHLNPANPRVRAVSEVLRNMAQELKLYFRNLYVKKRQPAATHFLVIMVSEERRNKKPYALPVQFVPYHSIRDQYIRDLSKNIKEEMTTLGMKAVVKFYLYDLIMSYIYHKVLSSIWNLNLHKCNFIVYQNCMSPQVKYLTLLKTLYDLCYRYNHAVFITDKEMINKT